MIRKNKIKVISLKRVTEENETRESGFDNESKKKMMIVSSVSSKQFQSGTSQSSTFNSTKNYKPQGSNKQLNIYGMKPSKNSYVNIQMQRYEAKLKKEEKKNKKLENKSRTTHLL